MFHDEVIQLFKYLCIEMISLYLIDCVYGDVKVALHIQTVHRDDVRVMDCGKWW